MFRYSFLLILMFYACSTIVTECLQLATSTTSVPQLNKTQSSVNITSVNKVHHEYIDRVTCDHNPDICGEPVCKLRFKTRLTKAATIGCNVLKKPAYTFLARAQLYYRFTGGFRKFLLDREEDVCKYLNGSRTEILLNRLLPNMRYALEINAVCPMTDRIMVNDLVLGLYLFENVFIPAGDYYIYLDVHTEDYLIMSTKFYFNIPDGKSVIDYAMG